MGYSHFEFIKQFKIFAGEMTYTLSDNQIEITAAVIDSKTEENIQNTSLLIITFSAQSDRIIGSLNISRLFVKFHFINYTEDQYQLFLKKFDLSFQRGGG